MPLRSLLYIARVYEKLVPIHSRYRKNAVPLPKPEFYTFYNGTQPWEKEKVLQSVERVWAVYRYDTGLSGAGRRRAI